MCMKLDDFVRLTPDEFLACMKAHTDAKENKARDEWQRMRLQTTLLIQPHISKTISPEKLFALPWDEEDEPQPHEETPEEQEARRQYARELARKLNSKSTD
nr:MAG TPA: hypothetical protein [Caudoviricetes sp.]